MLNVTAEFVSGVPGDLMIRAKIFGNLWLPIALFPDATKKVRENASFYAKNVISPYCSFLAAPENTRRYGGAVAVEHRPTARPEIK